MTWKLLWQALFILGMSGFLVMFFIFSFKGFQDIIKLIRDKNEQK